MIFANAQDNVDYSPSGYDEYFPYDFLEKLGETDRDISTIPHGNSKCWIAFEGRIGSYWTKNILIHILRKPSPGPLTMNEENHEYYTFTHGTFGTHWGFDNPGENPPWTNGQISWEADPPDGD